MFQLLGIAFLVSIPVFYIYGIFQFFRNEKAGNSRKQAIADLLKASGNAKTDKEKEAFSLAADYLESQQGHTTANKSFQLTKSSTQTTPLEQSVALNQEFQSPFHSIDNINLLLYLGAFLMIVACGIFASYSYASLTGLMKTIAMAGFAATFYFSGLFMYTKSERIRPAAVVFTAIGLLAFPLVGVVAYNFWLDHSYLKLIWFVTSLKCVVFYFIAFRIIRHQLLEYLSVFTALSLFQSTIGLFELPVHYYYWGFSLFSLGALTLDRVGKRTGKQELQSKPLFFTSQFLIPISLILSLFETMSPPNAFLQTGITFGLASVYYAFLSGLSLKAEEKKLYLFVAGSGFPVAVSFCLRQFLTEFMQPEMGFALLTISLVYAQLSEVFSWKKMPDKQEVFGVLSGLLPLAASVFTIEFHRLNLFVLVAAIGVNLFLLFRIKQRAMLIFYSIAVFTLPYTLSQLFPILQDDVYISALYLGTLIAFLPIRKLILSLKEGKELLGFAYSASCVSCFFFICYSNEPNALVILLLLPIVIFLLTLYEKMHKLAFIPILLIYFAIFRLSAIYSFEQYAQAILFLATGIGFYAISYLSVGERKQQVMLMGLLGPFLAFAISYDVVPKYVAPLSMMVAGGLLAFESIRQKSTTVLNAGIAVMLAGAQLGLHDVFKITEVQVYTVSWAAYVLWLSISTKEKQKDGYYMLALSLLTIPLGIEALEKQLRGLVLILEGIALVLAGIQFKKKIVWQWGTGVLVLEVLYYMRSFLLNLPTWAIFGGLGLLLLGGSVFLLMQRKPNKI